MVGTRRRRHLHSGLGSGCDGFRGALRLCAGDRWGLGCVRGRRRRSRTVRAGPHRLRPRDPDQARRGVARRHPLRGLGKQRGLEAPDSRGIPSRRRGHGCRAVERGQRLELRSERRREPRRPRLGGLAQFPRPQLRRVPAPAVRVGRMGRGEAADELPRHRPPRAASRP